MNNAARKSQELFEFNAAQFPEGSAERLLWRICLSHRCPGLINGEAVLCEAFHSEALDVLKRARDGKAAQVNKARVDLNQAGAA